MLNANNKRDAKNHNGENHTHVLVRPLVFPFSEKPVQTDALVEQHVLTCYTNR